MTLTAKTLATASIVCGTMGLVLFLVYKSEGKKSRLGYLAKGLVALGVYLLAFAVLQQQKEEEFCSSYCSTSHDPDSAWSYRAYCGPPPS